MQILLFTITDSILFEVIAQKFRTQQDDLFFIILLFCIKVHTNTKNTPKLCIKILQFYQFLK